MPGGMMIPAAASQMRQLTTAVNGFFGVAAAGPLAPSSALFFGQQPSTTMDMNMNTNMNMMEGGYEQFHQYEMGAANASESEVAGHVEDGFDSNYVIENPEGGSSDELTEVDEGRSANRRRYHRHTPHQIQAMEKQCPHPDDKQRKELSRQLGLAPLQVKFWFQNKRTQKKAQFERNENAHLRLENEKLRGEHMKLIEGINNASCHSCGGPAAISQMTLEQQQLIIENARIRDEINQMSEEFAKYLERPIMPYSNGIGDMFRTFTGPTEGEKPFIIELAVAAMEEFLQVAHVEEPLWLPSADGRSYVLNDEEYLATFGNATDQLLYQQEFKREASRETAIITMDHSCLVEMLMNVGHWSTIFSSIISRAITVEVLSPGVAGTYDGSCQVMVAEFQLPAPHVPTRQTSFVRYCKQHEGIWAIVDVSLESLRPSQQAMCRRRPSGCLVQALADGYSKVIWFEHMEVVDDSLVPILYKPLVNSGLAFGARRWLGTLDRQCERLARALTTVPLVDIANMGLISNEARLGLIRLAERMVIGYNRGVSSTSTQTWTVLTGIGSNDVRLMSKRYVSDPSRPTGLALCAATSFWLPNSPQIVFDFLRNDTNRPRWDVLSNCGQAEQVVHIRNGRESENYTSVYRVDSTDPNRQSLVMIQETCSDASGSFIIFAPVQFGDMNGVLASGSHENVPILPSGIAILPDGTKGGGSLLTVGFQVLVDSMPNAKLSLSSIATVCGLATSTEARIKACLMVGNNAQMYANDGHFAFPNVGANGAI